MADFDPSTNNIIVTVAVSDILYGAYRKAGALKHPGQGISDSESTEGLGLLNAMIDGMKAENILIWFQRRTVVNAVTGQKSYSVGPGQDWDIPRPPKIPRAGFIVPSNPGNDPQNIAEVAMEILESYTEYAAFVAKNVECQIPLALYYQEAIPFGQAILWPVPSIDSQIAIYTQEVMSEFQSVDDQVLVPYGWREGLEYNLAIRVHHNYPSKPLDPLVVKMAADYKRRMWRPLPIYIGTDPAAMQGHYASRNTGGKPSTWIPY